jgi:hypothetical protein
MDAPSEAVVTVTVSAPDAAGQTGKLVAFKEASPGTDTLTT